jgi:hypothetical protein
MTSLDETLAGLEAVLSTIDGLRVYDHIPGDPSYPAAVILPPAIPDYRDDLGDGSMSVRFPVLLLVPSTLARMQLQLFPFLEKSGSRSIFAKIEADRSLGGLNVDAYVVNVLEFDASTRVGVANVYGRVVNVDVIITED